MIYVQVGKIYYEEDDQEQKCLVLESSVSHAALVYWYGWGDITMWPIEHLKEYKCNKRK
jgi:hypothetical protein